MAPDAVVAVHNATHVAEARRAALELAHRSHMIPDDCGKVALVVTELATNLIRHAQDGSLVLRQVPGPALEVISLDRGPGIQDPERCFQDGYSTGRTPGNGLGAVRRLSSAQEIYSVPGQGTVLLARVGQTTAPANYGAISVPYPGQLACGDAWSVHQYPDCVVIAMADGLGHGEEAARASTMALAFARQHPDADPEQLLHRMNPVLRGSRGAAVVSCRFRLQANLLDYAGAGNIAASLNFRGQRQRNLVSMNGTVGGNIPKIQGFRYSWQAGTVFVLHTDGLSANWSLDRYPGIFLAHPTLIAGVLFRDHRRLRDDATVLVLRL